MKPYTLEWWIDKRYAYIVKGIRCPNILEANEALDIARWIRKRIITKYGGQND